MRKLITLFRCCVPSKEKDDYKENLEETRETEGADVIMTMREIMPHYKFDDDCQDQNKNNHNNSIANSKANEESKKTEKEIVEVSKLNEKGDTNVNSQNICKINPCETETEKLHIKVEEILENEMDKILIEEKYILEEEKEIIKYTKRGLLSYFDNLSNISDFDLLYNQNNLVLKTRKIGTDLSSCFLLAKTVYTLPISTFDKEVSIEFISKMIYDTEERIKWDRTLKAFNKLYDNKVFDIVQVWIYSPVVLVSERDHIDKRINFYNEEKFYSICSAVPDGLYPEENKVVRIKIYISYNRISKDKENFYFTTYTQTDFKMNIPLQILKVTLPNGVLSWYKSLVEAIKFTVKSSE